MSDTSKRDVALLGFCLALEREGVPGPIANKIAATFTDEECPTVEALNSRVQGTVGGFLPQARGNDDAA